MTGSPLTRLTAVAALACAGIALLASSALASSVTVSGGNRLAVSAGGNERNDFAVSYVAGADAYLVADPAGVNANGPCVSLDPDTASCPGAGIGRITVSAGGGSDTALLDRHSIPPSVEGDLNGGSGNDRLTGSAAADSLSGSSGSDLLDGGPGADELRGGRDRDTAVYWDRATPVVVSIGSGEDNDGNELDQSGVRRDTVRGDIEQLVGGAAGDLLFGDSSNEGITGGPGDDRIFGLRGDDTLVGGAGAEVLSGGRGGDLLLGGPGDDRLGGGPQNDRLSGAAGDDVLVGKKGFDAINGKAGIDRILARDGGRDRKINCGSGNNRREGAKRDRSDPRAISC